MESKNVGLIDAKTLKKYIVPLPNATKLKPTKNKHFFVVSMEQSKHQFHPQIPVTTVWSYNGIQVPLFEVRRNKKVTVEWVNALPKKHLFEDAIDHTLDGAMCSIPDVHNVVHLHGGATASASDGGPSDFYLPGQSRVFEYHNEQLPTMLIFHDHAMGIERLNTYAGLTGGVYLIRDPKIEKPLHLPRGLNEFEIPIVLQDKTFNQDGSLFFPVAMQPTPPPPVCDQHRWLSHFLGDTIIVNGAAWPFLEVQKGKKYRFRFANVSDTRTFSFRLVSPDTLSKPFGPAFWQIGTDGGYLPKPIKLNDPEQADEFNTELILAPAERADVIIDFSHFPVGTEFILRNSANAPFPEGKAPDPNTVGQVMKIIVVEAKSKQCQKIDTPSCFYHLNPKAAIQVRQILLTVDGQGSAMPNALYLNNSHFALLPVTETPLVYTTEIWEFINLTKGMHPMHLHLIQFQLLNRQTFRADDYLRDFLEANKDVMPGDGIRVSIPVESYLTGEPTNPKGTNEDGWKDTIRADPQQVTRIIARFAPQKPTKKCRQKYPFDATQGLYMYHCHINSHVDNDMMRPYQLLRQRPDCH